MALFVVKDALGRVCVRPYECPCGASWRAVAYVSDKPRNCPNCGTIADRLPAAQVVVGQRLEQPVFGKVGIDNHGYSW
jgi:hypothetical protein